MIKKPIEGCVRHDYVVRHLPPGNSSVITYKVFRRSKKNAIDPQRSELFLRVLYVERNSSHVAKVYHMYVIVQANKKFTDLVNAVARV